ncbi:MAG: radical SAM protein [Clostridia bacterium]|nr:radical SAM protein [Clostridia bacterium]
MICKLCPRECGVDRAEKVGFCGVTDQAVVARAELHFWEEPYLAGCGASGAVFFSGCNLRCVFCQNAPISHFVRGEGVSPSRLADIFRALEDEGAENIDLITPTPFVPTVKAALDLYRPSLPVIYNCGGYEKAETIRSLEGYIDVYLPDYKCFDDALALRYSAAPHYRAFAEEAILEMRRQVSDVVKEGVLQKGVAVRHLVLPGQAKDSIAVLDRVYALLGKDTYLSVMSQYTPCGASGAFPELGRKVSPLEYKAVVAHALRLGFENAYMQEESSASKDYIPAFLREED